MELFVQEPVVQDTGINTFIPSWPDTGASHRYALFCGYLNTLTHRMRIYR